MAYRDDNGNDGVWGFFLLLFALIVGLLLVSYFLFYQPVAVDRAPDTIVVPGGAPGEPGPVGPPGPQGPPAAPGVRLPTE